MFARAKTQSLTNVWGWLMLLVIAGAIVVLLASSARGTDVARPPGLFPPDVPALPMPSPDSQPVNVPSVEAGLAAQLWKAIQLHKNGKIDEAIAAWEAVRLPPEKEHWRLLMLGVAYMQNGDEHRSESLLSEAKWMAPENPVTYYALGLLWFGKAESADEWYDASGLDPFCTASTAQPDMPPRTRSMYRLAAMMAFEKAVNLAGDVDIDQSLLTKEWLAPDENANSEPIVTPRVRDALEVFGGERFEGRSHLALGLMHMERDALSHAETHLDSAADLGEPTGAAFHDLGRKFEKEGAASEALRAHLKAFSHGGGVACLEDAFKQFERAMFGK